MHSITKNVGANSEKKSKKSIFRPFLGFFPKNQPNQIFPKKSGSVTFEPLWSPNFMQKIRKNVGANSEKS